MRKVVIGIDETGTPYVVSKPRKVEVSFKQGKKKTWKKQWRTYWYLTKKKLGLAEG